MSFKDLTPEQRQAMVKKSAATRLAKKLKIENDHAIAILNAELDHFSQPKAGVEPEPDANDPFSLFLEGVPPSTREVISVDELRDIYAANVAKAEAEKKTVAKKAVSEIASNNARMQAGLIPMATRAEMETARRNAELVRWTCELPPAGDQGEIPDDGLRIDGRLLRHGSVHTLTRAQYDSYREIIYRVSEHELMFKGQGRRQRQWLLGRSLGSNNDGSSV